MKKHLSMSIIMMSILGIALIVTASTLQSQNASPDILPEITQVDELSHAELVEMWLADKPPMPTPNYIEMPKSIPQPEDAMDLTTMLEYTYAITGLHTIDSLDYTWVSYGDWMSEMGVGGGRGDPNAPVLVVAMRGRGYWNGAGFVPPDYEITGETFGLNALTGDSFSQAGGYMMPMGETGIVYRQMLNNLTRTPIIPIPPESTEEPQPFPTLPK